MASPPGRKVAAIVSRLDTPVKPVTSVDSAAKLGDARPTAEQNSALQKNKTFQVFRNLEGLVHLCVLSLRFQKHRIHFLGRTRDARAIRRGPFLTEQIVRLT